MLARTTGRCRCDDRASAGSKLGAAVGALLLAVPLAALAASAPAGAAPASLVGNYALSGLSCPSASSCWAVGVHGTTVFDAEPLADEWNGTRWANASIASNPAEPANTLLAVACASSSFCWAVGYSDSPELDSTPLAELWNGHRWAVGTTPHPSSSDVSLASVTCVARSSCWAVGGYLDAGGAHAPYAERWSETNEGSQWAESTMAVPKGATASGLSSIACVTDRNCTAVGSATTSKGAAVTLAEHFNGTKWTVSTTPNPSGSLGSYLDGVSCSGGSNCVAVGYYRGSGAIAYPSLAEHWNGTSWKLMSTPNATGAVGGSILDGIACSSSTSCEAVGYSGSSAGHSALVERLKGTTWGVGHAPNPPGSTGTILSGVACPSSTSCDAVGYGTKAGAEFPLGEHWNGTAWKLVATAS